MRRNELLSNGEVYHIFSKSIADFKVFNSDSDFRRMQQLMKYYKVNNEIKFSDFLSLKIVERDGFDNVFNILLKDKENLVQIIAYCLMPTHVHLILKQLRENGISNYMSNILNSYSRYFNTLHKRKGPLWESRFKSVLVKSDEQLFYLTSYLHLNPVTAKLIDHPEDWAFSSYGEYLSKISDTVCICQFDDILEIKPSSYRKFVNNRIAYQRELAKIKSLTID